MAREINLVPDVKGEMIKALKLRNFIFFLCIVVASASAGVVAVLASIAGGQQAVVDGKKQTLATLSEKVNSYTDLNDFLTIKDQLGNLSDISSNKTVLSRTFGILTAMIPTGADTITISELNINLAEDNPTLSFDAQANAGRDPYIDYNVLDSFKKSMQYLRYDYGEYVDKNGATIPAYCMVEKNDNGSVFYDQSKGYYAYWQINGEGCNPSAEEGVTAANYTTEDYNGNTMVRIWRTPQFSDWYKATEVEGQPYMSLDGAIANVPHFESSCIKYSGTLNGTTPVWAEPENSCNLVPDGTDGIVVSDSSNGRGNSGELVLRFSAVITLDPAAYSFKNTHMLALAPSGRRNVTDSYVQIQNMFEKRAEDCAEGDTDCITDNSTNQDQSQNQNQNNTSGGNNG